MSSKKVAVITGSGDGLGKGIAERLAQDGFAIVLSDINPDTLATTEAEFKARGAAVSAFLGDVASAKISLRWSNTRQTPSAVWMCLSTMPALKT